MRFNCFSLFYIFMFYILITSSLMIVALLSDLSAEVIFLPKSASTIVADFNKYIYFLWCNIKYYCQYGKFWVRNTRDFPNVIYNVINAKRSRLDIQTSICFTDSWLTNVPFVHNKAAKLMSHFSFAWRKWHVYVDLLPLLHGLY